MRRFILIGTIVVFLGILLVVAVVRRRQVWIGHEKIHSSSISYAGEFSSLEECRREVEKYGGFCSSRCTWADNVRWDNCKLTVTVEAKQPH
jgi:hypothetical protein